MRRLYPFFFFPLAAGLYYNGNLKDQEYCRDNRHYLKKRLPRPPFLLLVLLALSGYLSLL